MAKKGNRLREFEKNHRVLDISTAQEARKEKKKEKQANSENAVTVDAADRQKTGKKWSRIKLAGMGISLVFIAIVLFSVKNIYDLKEEEENLKQRNVQLKQIKEELLLEMDYVNSDEYIEEQARRELHLVKGNELIFYFPEDWEDGHVNQEEDTEDNENE